jgi:hypothetical protein
LRISSVGRVTVSERKSAIPSEKGMVATLSAENAIRHRIRWWTRAFIGAWASPAKLWRQ